MKTWQMSTAMLAMAMLTFGAAATSQAGGKGPDKGDVEIENSFNDNSTNTATLTDNSNNSTTLTNTLGAAVVVEDVLNDKSDNSQTATNSFNDNSANSEVKAEGDRNAVAGVYSTAAVDNSINNSIAISDIQVAVAATVLAGEVADNNLGALGFFSGVEIDTGSNNLVAGCGNTGSFTTNGISAISMNTGLMSQAQQAINVQANMGLGQ